MSKIKYFLSVFILIYSQHIYALGPEAVEGKSFYPACHVCHDPGLDPPLGPPMWAVQRQYKRNTLDKEDFIETMVEFVKAPTLEKVIHQEAVRQLGLMPPLPLPDEMLKKIAFYILEESFEAPCEHWEIAVKRAMKKGDLEHAEKDKSMLKRFCRK